MKTTAGRYITIARQLKHFKHFLIFVQFVFSEKNICTASRFKNALIAES